MDRRNGSPPAPLRRRRSISENQGDSSPQMRSEPQQQRIAQAEAEAQAQAAAAAQVAAQAQQPIAHGLSATPKTTAAASPLLRAQPDDSEPPSPQGPGQSAVAGTGLSRARSASPPHLRQRRAIVGAHSAASSADLVGTAAALHAAGLPHSPFSSSSLPDGDRRHSLGTKAVAKVSQAASEGAPTAAAAAAAGGALDSGLFARSGSATPHTEVGSTSNISSSSHTPPRFRQGHLRFGRHKANLRINGEMLHFVDDKGHHGKLHIERDICALTISIYADISRPEVDGQVMVLRKAKSLSRHEWVDWVHMLLLNLSMYFFLVRLVGPISAALALAVSIWRHTEIDAYLVQEFELSGEALKLCKAAVSWLAFASNFIMLLPGWKAPLAVAVTLVALALLARDWMMRVFSLPSNFRYISPTYPILVSYPFQSDMAELLEFRRQVKASPLASAKAQNVAVGSFWVEVVLSVLLYHDVYNSLRLRRVMVFVLTYVLPLVYAFQMLYVFGPRFLRLQGQLLASVHADYSIRALRAVVHFIRKADILPGIPAFVLNAVERLRKGMQAISDWAAYFSAFIVPIDEAITYFRAKFEPLRLLVVRLGVLFQPLVHLLTSLGHLVAAGLAPLAQNASVLLKVLVMPVVNVVANTSRVVRLTTTRPVHEVNALVARVKGTFLGLIHKRPANNDAAAVAREDLSASMLEDSVMSAAEVEDPRLSDSNDQGPSPSPSLVGPGSGAQTHSSSPEASESALMRGASGGSTRTDSSFSSYSAAAEIAPPDGAPVSNAGEVHSSSTTGNRFEEKERELTASTESTV